MDYYRNLFEAIHRRLMVLGEKHHVKVLVVRLASTWPGDAVSALDREAHVMFAKATQNSDYGFVDFKNCARTKATKAGISKRLNGTRTNSVTRCMLILWKTHYAISWAGKSIRNSQECVYRLAAFFSKWGIP